MAPDDHAKHYDIISDPEKRLAHEGQFLLWLLAKAPGRRVLDMACGTGVQAEFLAEHGATVTARDVDGAMIAFARGKRPHPNVTYEVADMREGAGGPFDLAIVMGNSISLLPEYDDVVKTLARMKEALVPAGVGFVHVINYSGVEAARPRQKVARKPTAGGEIMIVKDMIPWGKGGPMLVSFSYFERAGTSWATSGTQSVLLDLRRPLLEHAAKQAGLEIAAEYGDYDASPFDEELSPDLLILLAK